MRKQILQAKQAQTQQLVSLGAQLNELRTQKSLDIAEVSVRTHIQPRLLKAIEAGDMDALPEPVYIKSFIRQYANALGLNGVEFAGSFEVEPKLAAPKALFWQGLIGSQLSALHLYAVYGVVVLASVQGLSFVVNRSAAVASVSPESLQKWQESLPAAKLPMMGPQPNMSGVPTVIRQSKTGESVRVGLTFNDQSWVRVVSDGKEEDAYEGVLPQGTERVWTAQKQVVIRAGNAGGIMARFNEGTAKPLGAPGAVQEVKFPPDSRYATLPMNSAQ